MLNFKDEFAEARAKLLRSLPIDVGSWHSQPTKGNPLLITMEVPFYSMYVGVPVELQLLQEACRPNLPWAEEHFLERVHGLPMNPAPSHVRWPWAHKQHHDENEVFSHTYPERFWPRFANEGNTRPNGRVVAVPHNGIRYEYGDLGDVINLLRRQPGTRQAVLPVFFPEDTGNVDNVRIPCSLTYSFLIRSERLHCRYTMRSCDFVRHFKDDVYMAARLVQFVAENVGVKPGRLYVDITSLHAMEGDRWKMEEERKNGMW